MSPSERTERSHQSDHAVSLEADAFDGQESARKAALFEFAPCAIALIDLDGRLSAANQAFCRLSGIAESELNRFYFQQLLSPAGRLVYDTQLAATLLVNGNLKEVALELLSTLGSRVPVLINAELRPGGDSQPGSIAMAIFDVTERRSKERHSLATRKTAEQMADVVRHSSDAIVMVSAERRVESWNDGAETMFGYQRSEVLGMPFPGILFATNEAAEMQLDVELLNGGKSISRETVCVRQDGTLLTVSVNLSPHLEPPGRMTGFSAIIRDTSKQKIAEKALIQSEKLASVGRLASSIAHEINNPLEAITNLLFILATHVLEPETKKYVTAAQDELARVSEITTHTLRFHNQSSSRRKLQLGALFESVLALYRGRMNNSSVIPVIKRSDAAPLLCFDGEVRQILANLVGNAIDAMRTGGTLHLRNRDATHWSSNRRGVRITIADTGTGMDRETLSRIFEAFFTTKGHAGTGLGMWITQELVAKNDGSIRIRSSTCRPHSGTVIALFFPHDPAEKSELFCIS